MVAENDRQVKKTLIQEDKRYQFSFFSLFFFFFSLFWLYVKDRYWLDFFFRVKVLLIDQIKIFFVQLQNYMLEM